MLDSFLSYLAPHHCSGCGEMGTLLCENCKYDITHEPFEACVACGSRLAGKQGLCRQCAVPYERAWCVAPRHDTLQRLIDAYKFSNAQAAHRSLVVLLDDHLPELPANVCIVPVPTVNAHIRQRGYDHTLLVARRLARARSLGLSTALQRVTSTRQRGATARQRTEQAKRAFHCPSPLDPGVIYLLIDDVMTTGATLKYAAKALKNAGARTVWVASISRQTLD